MKVSETMSRDVQVARPDQSIREAALLMREHDVGALPVGESERLVGMVTDRDIVVRAIADGRDAETPVREVMSSDLEYCFEDQDIDEVARRMAELEVRRLPVLDREERLVGIVSLANIAHSRDDDATDTLVKGVAQPH